MTSGSKEPVIAVSLLLILQLSDSMQEEVDWLGKPEKKVRLARWLIDLVIDDLAAAQDSNSLSQVDVDIGAFGYRKSAEGISFVQLLKGIPNSQSWTTLSSLLQGDVETRPHGPRRWVDLDAANLLCGHGGSPDALSYAYELVKKWLGSHPQGQAVVVHCGDETICEDTSHVRHSLNLLATNNCNLVLYTCLFSKQFPSQFRPSSQPADCLEPRWKELWYDSSPLVTERRATAPRAFSINVWPRQEIRRSVIRRTGPCSGDQIEPWPASWRVRHLLLQKGGNAQTECEDAFTVSVSNRIAAISDGAGEGIFANAWARILTDSFVASPVNLDDVGSLRQWLRSCRDVWWKSINYPALRWSQREKVDETGGGATFLGFRMDESVSRPADKGLFGWSAWAIGDSCLFWVRDNRLRASFPIVASRHFGLAPPLLRTQQNANPQSLLVARGQCLPGDCFFFATDAVAQSLLAAVEEHACIDWSRYLSIDEDAWRKEIDELRKSKQIVNDDCTLLAIRVESEMSQTDLDQLSFQ